MRQGINPAIEKSQKEPCRKFAGITALTEKLVAGS
jgi:hypothetical protein